MDSSSRTAELQTPLLDIEERFEENETSSTSVEIDNDDEKTCFNELVMMVILPMLLLSQFGMVFLMHSEQTAYLSWRIVNCSILLFALTAALYRNTCKDAKVQTLVLLLLPEIIMDIVLGLIFFDRIGVSYAVLLFGILFLSMFVVVTTISLMCKRRGTQEVDDEESESNDLVTCQVV